MPPKSRPKNPSVVERLRLSPHAFSFIQAVRVLERVALSQPPAAGTNFQLSSRAPVAGFSPPAREVVRLHGEHSLEFPESEIGGIAEAEGQWQLRVKHVGLTGAMGVLPFHYTELILQRVKQKDFSLRDFLDLFNHRLASLYYQASVKYRLPIEYERKRLFKSGKAPVDMQTQSLLALVGMGTGKLTSRSAVRDEALIYYGGLLSAQVRTTSGLQQILQHYFGIPVAIQEFVGHWQELIPDIRTRLASRQAPKGQNASLGRNAILGSKGWFSQGKIKICLGPLDYDQFRRFAPGTTSLKALNDLVRMYVGVEHDYSFVIRVQSENFPRQISFASEAKPIMGWNTWLSSSATRRASSEKHLDIHVSANRLK